MNMKIVFDKHNEEYGLLKEEKALDAMNLIARLDNHEIKKSELPKSVRKIKIPVITFFNENREAYDSAFYTSKHAEERYEILQEVSNLKEFFECIQYLKKEKKYN